MALPDRSCRAWLALLSLCIGAAPRLLPGAPTVPATVPSVRYPLWRAGQPVDYVISVRENRRSHDQRPELRADLSLERVLHLHVDPREVSPAGGVLRMRLDRIVLSGRSNETPIAYDSRQDRGKRGDALADLLATVAGRTFEVKISAAGEFLDVRGLDSAWRSAGQLMAPAPLLGIQFMFRDQTMLGLLRETLALPIGRDSDANGETWRQILQTAVPLVTPLAWDAAFTTGDRADCGGRPCRHVTAAGSLSAVRPMGDVGEHGLRTEAVDGARRSDLRLDDDTGQVIRHQIEQNVVLSLVLRPPAGGETLRMKLEQTTQISVQRASRGE